MDSRQQQQSMRNVLEQGSILEVEGLFLMGKNHRIRLGKAHAEKGESTLDLLIVQEKLGIIVNLSGNNTGTTTRALAGVTGKGKGLDSSLAGGIQNILVGRTFYDVLLATGLAEGDAVGSGHDLSGSLTS